MLKSTKHVAFGELLMKTRIFGVISLLSCLTLTRTWAADLDIPISVAKALAVHPSGQFVGAQSGAVTRYHPDGAVAAELSFTGGATFLAVENSGAILVKDAIARSLKRVQIESMEEVPLPNWIRTFTLQADGKIVVLENNPQGAATRHTLARLNPNGTRDESFATSMVNGSITEPVIALQQDGKILLVTKDGGSISRFEPNGNLDSAFNAPPRTMDIVSAIVVQPDGKVLVGGSYLLGDATKRSGVVRLNADGTLDAPFDPALGLHAPVDSIALQANGKIVLAGHFYDAARQAGYYLTRLNPDGTDDPTFSYASPYFPARPMPLVLEESGSIITAFVGHLVRISNPEGAAESFTRDGATLTWMRGGSAPEVYQTRFQFSQEGIAWADLGMGTRIPGGWRLEGLPSNSTGLVRARGYVGGSIYESTLEISNGIRLGVPAFQPQSGEVLVQAAAPEPVRGILQMSTDLREWTNLQTSSLSSQSLEFRLTQQAERCAFYRILQVEE
jgi:uncharacterized delta-60 repeat protein